MFNFVDALSNDQHVTLINIIRSFMDTEGQAVLISLQEDIRPTGLDWVGSSGG